MSVKENAQKVLMCRWCGKAGLRFYNNKWQHRTAIDMQECQHALPFVDQLAEYRKLFPKENV